MNYFIGMDGGGTKCTCVVTDINLDVVHRVNGGPTNFLSIGTETAAKNILKAIDECKSNLVIKDEDIAAICLGTAGAGRIEDISLMREKITELMASENRTMKNFEITSDIKITLEGAFSGDYGIILISGTGSICYGKNSEGNYFRTGGYGKVLGDEGSGYSIGRKGLRQALRSYDGRCLSTNLMKDIFRFMEVDSADEVINKVYKQNYEVASLAEAVINSASKGDEAALTILNDEAEELLLHLYAILPKMNEANSKLAFGGSLLTKENRFREIVIKKINKAFKGISVCEPENPPEIGAVMIARRFFSS